MLNIHELNDQMHWLVHDIKKAALSGDEEKVKRCCYQLEGMLHALDVLGLYDPKQHNVLDDIVNNYGYKEAI